MKAKDLNFILKADLLKKIIANTLKMATKKASLHIYGVRSMYNIMSVCRTFAVLSL